ncbi:MAG: alpha/beta hydrolase [Devosia sp.]|uniref:alpha/beta hydrolase n=1 Tax=Devosia sp. TaxID=1871048 RepID=UPI001A57ED32|nr:alpha/beta hydrolase [Devosia sp.]MBL8598301.1 alpha/beta hydrolase [Devosia sp.]
MTVAILPELQAELDRVEAAVGGVPDIVDLTPEQNRDLNNRYNAPLNVDLPELAEIRLFEFPANADLATPPIEGIVYRPTVARRGKVFFVHGGGWAVCHLRSHERFLRMLAIEAQCEVIGIDYRLAPEHPFPAAINDVTAGLRTLLDHANELGLDPGPTVVSGDSAGANLGLGMMVGEVQAGRALPKGAVLYYGPYSQDFDQPSYRYFAEGYGLTLSALKHIWKQYLPNLVSAEDPRAVPLSMDDATLATLPRIDLLAAELDPVTSDSVLLRRRLDTLGRPGTLHIEPGVTHGFLQMTSKVEAARRATLLIGQLVREQLDAAK